VTGRPGALSYLLGGAFHRLAWMEWGDPAAPPVVCVHGLTRNGRDFDVLAAALSAEFWVICPDLPGRGQSSWLPDAAFYHPGSYVQALSHLLAPLGPGVGWVGTSLGGICGMMIAAASGNPIGRMVLNDIGPFIPAAALRRIRDYMSMEHSFTTLRELERHLRFVHAPFGVLTDAQWAHLAARSARPLPDGRLALHYDPAIAGPALASAPEDVDMGALWAAIRAPVLAVRGETSDLLLPDTFSAMLADGAEGLTVPGAGHAPALMDGGTIAAIREFLLTATRPLAARLPAYGSRDSG
jgi:pimeloyl-ACP methyl ester carboxylesterase